MQIGKQGNQTDSQDTTRLGKPANMTVDAAANEATAGRLLACGLFDPERKIPDVKRWLAAESGSASVGQTAIWTWTRRLPACAV